MLPRTGRHNYGAKRALPRVTFNPDTRESNIKSYAEFVDELGEHFSYPKAEVTRLINCVFHKLLTTMREGHSIRIPYFGTFSTKTYLSKITYNIGAQCDYDSPRVIQRCHPTFTPDGYSVHCCSPRGAFFSNFKSTSITRPSKYYYNTYEYWDQQQMMYRKRCLMLYDNPYTLTGVFQGHALPDSYALSKASKYKEEEHLREALKEINRIQDIKDMKPVERLLRKAASYKRKTAQEVYTYYNYSKDKPIGAGNAIYLKEQDKDKSTIDIIKDEWLINRKFEDYKSLIDEYKLRRLSWDIQERAFKKLRRVLVKFVKDFTKSYIKLSKKR
jgi:nucleoid DNA-binding protein